MSHLVFLSHVGITQHCPALSPTFILALLLTWNAWYVHRHTHPLHPHIHNQQCKHMPGLVLTAFLSEVSSSGRPGTDTCRRGQIRFNRTSVTTPAPGPYLHVCQCKQVVPGSRVLIWGFTSAPSTSDFTQRPRLCVWWCRGIMLPVWNIHAAPILMKRCILLFQTCWGSVELGPPQGRNRSILVDAGNVCHSQRVRSPKERVFEWMHTHTDACMSMFVCIKYPNISLFNWNDGQCARKSTVCGVFPITSQGE